MACCSAESCYDSALKIAGNHRANIRCASKDRCAFSKFGLFTSEHLLV